MAMLPPGISKKRMQELTGVLVRQAHEHGFTEAELHAAVLAITAALFVRRKADPEFAVNMITLTVALTAESRNKGERGKAFDDLDHFYPNIGKWDEN